MIRERGATRCFERSGSSCVLGPMYCNTYTVDAVVKYYGITLLPKSAVEMSAASALSALSV